MNKKYITTGEYIRDGVKVLIEVVTERAEEITFETDLEPDPEPKNWWWWDTYEEDKVIKMRIYHEKITVKFGMRKTVTCIFSTINKQKENENGEV